MASTTSGEAKKTYAGGCHCGFIRYTVDLDLSEPKASKCSCSICLKKNIMTVKIEPAQFKLVSPSSLTDVGDYTFGSGWMHHYFCKTCGIHCFGQGTFVREGKENTHMAINAVTLDQDQDPAVDLRKFKFEYWDGKGNNWANGAKDEPFEGGCY